METEALNWVAMGTCLFLHCMGLSDSGGLQVTGVLCVQSWKAPRMSDLLKVPRQALDYGHKDDHLGNSSWRKTQPSFEHDDSQP